jgi:penicillin-binding protein 1A
LRDWIFKPNRRGRYMDWLALDAWLDSSLYGTWASFKDWWSSYNNFFARFRVTGLQKAVVELCSEGLTLGTGALAIVLMFQIPAIDLTLNSNWRTGSEFSVTFLDRYGNEVGKRGILYSDAVPLEEVPDHLIKATLATEDRRFFQHFGIDIMGTARAIVENAKANDVVQGGSSITQQLAKNLFLTSERSIDRKIKEVFLALWLEARLSKKEILKLYLDRAYLGGGTFGVEAASQFYFGKSAREINLAEAALLAGLFKAPSRWAPHANPVEARARANQVLTNMVDAGYMTEGQVHGARLNPARVLDRSDTYAPNYFLDWAFEEVQRIARGKGEFTLTARLTLDPALQTAAEQAVEKVFVQHARGKRATQAALVSMENDGAVRAIVGGRDYGESQFNRATRAFRQPGSSFKSYVYLSALEAGFTPASRVVDGPVSCGRWSPGNYSGGFRGAMTLTDAFARSINTIAVKLSLDSRIGRDKVLEDVHKLGLTTIKKTCSLALGDQGIPPIMHTAAYAVFANGGKSVKPYAVLELRNTRDEVIYAHDRDEPAPEQIFELQHIEQLNFMMEKVVTQGTGRAAALDFTTVGGKTGTSSNYRDAWFVGYTGQYVTGVWFGNDNFSPMNNVTGGNLPAITWREYNAVAHTSMNIPQIPGLPLHPFQVEEQQRIAALKREDPTLGAVPEAAVRTSSRMPSRTRRTLIEIAQQFREAKKLTDQPDKGASLALPTVAQSR